MWERVYSLRGNLTSKSFKMLRKYTYQEYFVVFSEGNSNYYISSINFIILTRITSL